MKKRNCKKLDNSDYLLYGAAEAVVVTTTQNLKEMPRTQENLVPALSLILARTLAGLTKIGINDNACNPIHMDYKNETDEGLP